jgi:hypothetical protein
LNVNTDFSYIGVCVLGWGGVGGGCLHLNPLTTLYLQRLAVRAVVTTRQKIKITSHLSNDELTQMERVWACMVIGRWLMTGAGLF